MPNRMARADDGLTVRGQLRSARLRLTRAGVPNAWLDAEILLGHTLGARREHLHGHPEQLLTAPQRRRYRALVDRRARREPVAYLTGRKEFFGHDLAVSRAVLIPRPETEILVGLAIRWLEGHPTARRAIDLGTGSGAIAIAIAKAVPRVAVVAIDVEPRALRLAAANVRAQRVASRVRIVRADLLEGAPPSDLIAANLPYLSAARRRGWAEDLTYEPLLALDGGADGLSLIRRAIEAGPNVLRPGGCALFECDPAQAARIRRLAARRLPGAELLIHKDLDGKDRVVQVALPS